MGRICKWFRANQLTLNVKKSNFSLIGSSSHLSKGGSIQIFADDVNLDNVDSYTYLGIVINNQFTWNDHIYYICGKINKKLGLLRRIKSYIPLKARSTFFNSFILPLFYYGNIIWGHGGNFSLNPPHFRSSCAFFCIRDVEWNIKLFLCTSYLKIIFAARSQFHSMVILNNY